MPKFENDPVVSQTATVEPDVMAISTSHTQQAGPAVQGISDAAGVWGEHKGAGVGVKAVSQGGVGLHAFSAEGEAVHAETRSAGTAAIAAFNLNAASPGAAVFAKKEGAAGHAGFFEGNVWVSGKLAVGEDIELPNADCAEDFDVARADVIEPGMVVVAGEGGVLRQSAVCGYLVALRTPPSLAHDYWVASEDR